MSGQVTSVAVESAKRAVRAAGVPRDNHYDAHALSALLHTIDHEANGAGVTLYARIDALSRAMAMCAYLATRDADASRALIKSATDLSRSQMEILIATKGGALTPRGD